MIISSTSGVGVVFVATGGDFPDSLAGGPAAAAVADAGGRNTLGYKRMQKALELMNLKLTNVLGDVTGVTGPAELLAAEAPPPLTVTPESGSPFSVTFPLMLG